MKPAIMLSLILLTALLAGCVQQATSPPAACTSDAKICPDGSAVGRTGPSCEFAACPEPTATPAPTPTPTSNPMYEPVLAEVIIDGFAFSPSALTVSPGTTVTWTNLDSAPHTIKFSDSDSPTMSQGATFSRLFADAGTYEYSCGIHASMHGTIIVR